MSAKRGNSYDRVCPSVCLSFCHVTISTNHRLNG